MIVLTHRLIWQKFDLISRVEIRFSLLNGSQLTSRMRARISQWRLRNIAFKICTTLCAYRLPAGGARSTPALEPRYFTLICISPCFIIYKYLNEPVISCLLRRVANKPQMLNIYCVPLFLLQKLQPVFCGYNFMSSVSSVTWRFPHFMIFSNCL